MSKGWSIKGARKTAVRQGRRETLYKMIGKRNDGVVPCFVCGLPVKEKHATLEHVIPLSKGGEDEMHNLSISHRNCNRDRGDSTEIPPHASALVLKTKQA